MKDRVKDLEPVREDGLTRWFGVTWETPAPGWGPGRRRGAAWTDGGTDDGSVSG